MYVLVYMYVYMYADLPMCELVCVYTYNIHIPRMPTNICIGAYVRVHGQVGWHACMHASVCSFTHARHDTLSGDEPCSKENINLPPPRSLLRQDFLPVIPAPVRCPAMGERPFSRLSPSFPRCAREILARTIGPRPSGDSGPSLPLSCACSLLLFSSSRGALSPDIACSSTCIMLSPRLDGTRRKVSCAPSWPTSFVAPVTCPRGARGGASKDTEAWLARRSCCASDCGCRKEPKSGELASGEPSCEPIFCKISSTTLAPGAVPAPVRASGLTFAGLSMWSEKLSKLTIMPSAGELSSFSVFSGVHEQRTYVSVQSASFSLCGAQATRNQSTARRIPASKGIYSLTGWWATPEPGSSPKRPLLIKS